MPLATRLPISGEPPCHRLAAHHAIVWAILIVTVSAGHLSLPWVLDYSSSQIEFAKRKPAETVALTTRSISTELPVDTLTPPPVHPKREVGATPHRPTAHPTLTPTAKTEDVPATPLVTAEEAAPLDDKEGEGAVLYSVSGQFGGRSVGGNAALQWKIDRSAHLASLQVTGSHQFSTLFAWQLKAHGTVDGSGVRPALYEEDLLVAGERRQSHSIQFEEVLPPDTSGPHMDPLSALFSLSSALHALNVEVPPHTAPRKPAGYSIVVRLGQRSLHLRFQHQGEEELSTPFGSLQTEKYVTEYPNAFHDGPQITLWLAPAFRRALVRIVIEQPEVAALSFDLSSEPVAFPAWP
jgi:hypothetical protein